MYVIHFTRIPMLTSSISSNSPKNVHQASSLRLSSNHKRHCGRMVHVLNAKEMSVVTDGNLCNVVEEVPVSTDGTSCDEMKHREYMEMQRRRKIGLANKGKVPWNKGKKHTEETRELISQRTIDALRNPKVKRKMSLYPRFHSADSKAKIGLAMKRLWKERIKRKRLREKCYLTWAAAISQAAKLGGHGQQKLEWDSYEKMQADIAMEYIQWKTEKSKIKEFMERKAKRTAELRAIKMARLAEERKEKEKRQEAKESKRSMKKLGNQKELIKSSRLKLKDQNTKVDDGGSFCHGEKAVVTAEITASQVEEAIEKWDLEFIKKEKMRKRISFADQIQAAKNRQLKF